MKNNQTANCPCCPNHCPQDNLKCGKGQSYFSDDKTDSKSSCSNKHHGFGHHRHHGEDGFHKHGEPNFKSDSISGQLMQAARKMMHAVHHGDFSEEAFFDALSEVEKSELLSLLCKINAKDE